MTRVSLTGFAPDRCNRGHILRDREGAFIPGAVAVSWHPCDCPGGKATGGAWGHISVACEPCRAQGVTSVYYDPPCSASA